MCEEKRCLSLVSRLMCACFPLVGFLLLANAAKGATSPAPEGPESISVVLSLAKESFGPGEPIPFVVEVRNVGKPPLKVPEPSVLFKTVSIELLKDGRKLPAQRKWGGLAHPSVKLAPGKTLRCEHDITWLYPLTVPPGQYQVRAIYRLGSGESINSNTVPMAIRPLSQSETQAL